MAGDCHNSEEDDREVIDAYPSGRWGEKIVPAGKGKNLQRAGFRGLVPFNFKGSFPDLYHYPLTGPEPLVEKKLLISDTLHGFPVHKVEFPEPTTSGGRLAGRLAGASSFPLTPWLRTNGDRGEILDCTSAGALHIVTDVSIVAGPLGHVHEVLNTQEEMIHGCQRVENGTCSLLSPSSPILPDTLPDYPLTKAVTSLGPGVDFFTYSVSEKGASQYMGPAETENGPLRYFYPRLLGPRVSKETEMFVGGYPWGYLKHVDIGLIYGWRQDEAKEYERLLEGHCHEAEYYPEVLENPLSAYFRLWRSIGAGLYLNQSRNLIFVDVSAMPAMSGGPLFSSLEAPYGFNGVFLGGGVGRGRDYNAFWKVEEPQFARIYANYVLPRLTACPSSDVCFNKAVVPETLQYFARV